MTSRYSTKGLVASILVVERVAEVVTCIREATAAV